MSIFAKPQAVQTENDFGVKILFLHGLEGSPSGSKGLHLQKKWSAQSPKLRTSDMIELKENHSGRWDLVEKSTIGNALQNAYDDAVDAVNYMQPDIIVGSSMGGAILMKLYSEERYSGQGVFLAPAVSELLTRETIAKGVTHAKDTTTMWVFGEADTVVSNRAGVGIAKQVNGNILFSPGDGHRLSLALERGLIDSAILTCIEMKNKSQ